MRTKIKVTEKTPFKFPTPLFKIGNNVHCRPMLDGSTYGKIIKEAVPMYQQCDPEDKTRVDRHGLSIRKGQEPSNKEFKWRYEDNQQYLAIDCPESVLNLMGGKKLITPKHTEYYKFIGYVYVVEGKYNTAFMEKDLKLKS